MKLRLLTLILILSLASLACKAADLAASNPTPEMVMIPTSTEVAPQEPQAQETATEAVEPTAQPTPTAAATSTATPKPATPTALPSPTPLTSIEDTFDKVSEDWTKTVVITTQSSKMRSTFATTKGRLIYDLMDKETYVYQFRRTKLNADVEVSTIYENLGDLENGVSLICRAAPDFKFWYEARLYSQGRYAFYRYEYALREKDGKNPYVEISTGGVNFNFLYPDKPNAVKFTCKGDTLTLDINNGLKVFTAQDKTLTQPGLVGLGVLSFANPAVTIAFDEFKASNLP